MEGTIPENKISPKELRQRLKEQIRQAGEYLESQVAALVETAESNGPVETEKSAYLLRCRDFSDRVFELLDLTRDLDETSLLVLDNGTGYLPGRLAEYDTDIVAVELSDKLKKSAGTLNTGPNIIYKKTNPFLISQQYDLIVDSGILRYFDQEVLNYFLPRLARYGRRKMILEFRLNRPWYLHLFSGKARHSEPEEFRYSYTEITGLIETSCDMLLTQRNLSGSSLLVKALKKPHSYHLEPSNS
jgi:hypothetical protein